MLDELKRVSGQEYVPATSIALVYAGLGEKDQAFAWLEKGYEERVFSNAMAQGRTKMGQPTLRSTLRRPTATHGAAAVM